MYIKLIINNKGWCVSQVINMFCKPVLNLNFYQPWPIILTINLTTVPSLLLPITTKCKCDRITNLRLFLRLDLSKSKAIYDVTIVDILRYPLNFNIDLLQ